MIRIAISGAGGRMGQAVARCIRSSSDMSVAFGVDTYCQDADYPVFYTFEDTNLDADVVVDFSNPSALDGVLDYAERTGARVVLATTGYSNDQLERIKYFSKKVGIFQSSNMSLGVCLLGQLARDSARFLRGYDIEIVEAHHRGKADSPSGTALTLAKEINEVKDNSLDLVCGRNHGKRELSDLTVHSVRGGTVTGKHSVMFFGNGESISLSHEAESKEIFANGTLHAIRFIMTKEAGLYGMKDLLTESKPALTISSKSGFFVLHIDGVDESEWAGIFRHIQKCNLPLDNLICTPKIDGTLSVVLSFEEKNILTNALVKNKAFNLYKNISKIIITGVKNKGVVFEILRLMKSCGSDVKMIASSENTLSIFVDECNLVHAKYALKSYFKI